MNCGTLYLMLFNNAFQNPSMKRDVKWVHQLATAGAEDSLVNPGLSAFR